MAIEKSPLSDAIAAHWEALKSQKIEIPEWNATIYFDPLTMKERDLLMSVKGDGEMLVDTIILKAKDGDGNKLFTKADKPQLQLTAAPSIISRIGNRILAADRVDVTALGEH